MKNLSKSLFLGIAGMVSVGAANAYNPILICLYTSTAVPSQITTATTLSPPKIHASVWTTSASKPTWNPNPVYAPNIPAPGNRVCSAQYAGTKGFNTTNFGPNDTLKHSFVLVMPSGSLVTCSQRNLITKTSQIGEGIEYAYHVSITSADIKGVNGKTLTRINSCVVSNVSVNS